LENMHTLRMTFWSLKIKNGLSVKYPGPKNI
jgi:hypothetical protein